MQLLSRFRLQALFCALAVLCCALAGRPYADMGICDDGPYILMARHLAETGHVAYNGWSAAMLGWQLYLGAAFIKLFGYSFTTVRMSTLLVAMATAWLLQRTMVLAGVTERNATLGTLAFVLSPLYLMLGVTYMTDIDGLFAVVVCLYGCLRALHGATDTDTIGWLCFAVVTNAAFGTARQIAWLGILVMVPSALYVLGQRGAWRTGRRVLWAGGVATVVGALFIFACMQWFARQPYSIPEHLTVHSGREVQVLSQFFHILLGLPFLMLPLAVLFLPELARDVRRSAKVGGAAGLACALILLTFHAVHAGARPLLEPYTGDWVTKYGGYEWSYLAGRAPIFLGYGLRMVLTVFSLGGLLGVAFSLFGRGPGRLRAGEPESLPWGQLGVLVVPFVVSYALILIPRASSASGILDRYLLEPLAVTLPWIVRYYQERIRTRLPPAAVFVTCVMAIYGVVVVHNMFSFYRARVALADELRAEGVPETSVQNGLEYDLAVELRHANHLNLDLIENPVGAYVPALPLPTGTCEISWHGATPHLRPIYGVSFDPNACYGPAPFAPVHYSRWPYREPGTLYVVRYLPPGKLSH